MKAEQCGPFVVCLEIYPKINNFNAVEMPPWQLPIGGSESFSI